VAEKFLAFVLFGAHADEVSNEEKLFHRANANFRWPIRARHTTSHNPPR
jgi:hypothetical protein